MKILFVDDEKNGHASLADDLTNHGFDTSRVADGAEALARLRCESFDVILANMNLPKVNGVELLKRVKGGPSADTEFVMMSANGTIRQAVDVIKLGANDFVTMPCCQDEIVSLLGRIEKQRSRATWQRPARTADVLASIDRAIVGTSEAMARVKRLIKISAKTDANVLLCGETGVGKDLVASIIHNQSHRQGRPFIKVGCTMFPSSLIENELYGHDEGSFTGADESRPGRFELAESGSIYLDDVDDIPLDHQAKLLRAIEEKVFERVGGTKLIKADVRIIASTKLNLLDKITDKTFRQDLYYRLNVLRIRVPPLRDRREDIPALAEHLVQRFVGDEDFVVEPAVMTLLTQHDWPGNVRELYHTLERAWLVGGGCLTTDVLAGEIEGAPIKKRDGNEFSSLPHGGFKVAMDFAEKQLLVNALEACDGNKTAAANSLGMKPSTFRDKLAKHGLN